MENNDDNNIPVIAPENFSENPITTNGAGVAVETPIDEKTVFEEKISEFEKQKKEIEEQDKKLLAALDEVLEKHSQEFQKAQRVPPPIEKTRRIARSFAKKGVGIVSLGLILIFLGVVMIGCLFSSKPDFLLPLKLSPICAVLIGIELLFNQVSTRGNFRVNFPSVIISAVLVVGCCVMSVVLNKNYNKEKYEYNNRSVAAEIYDQSYRELRYVADIESLEVTVDLNPDGTGKDQGIEMLSYDDIVNIKVDFAGVIETPSKFAENCKKIIDGYRFMGIPVTNFYFENESSLHTFTLSVEGKFAQEFTESELVGEVKHIYMKNMDYIDDIKDFKDPYDSEE